MDRLEEIHISKVQSDSERAKIINNKMGQQSKIRISNDVNQRQEQQNPPQQKQQKQINPEKQKDNQRQYVEIQDQNERDSEQQQGIQDEQQNDPKKQQQQQNLNTNINDVNPIRYTLDRIYQILGRFIRLHGFKIMTVLVVIMLMGMVWIFQEHRYKVLMSEKSNQGLLEEKEKLEGELWRLRESHREDLQEKDRLYGNLVEEKEKLQVQVFKLQQLHLEELKKKEELFEQNKKLRDSHQEQLNQKEMTHLFEIKQTREKEKASTDSYTNLQFAFIVMLMVIMAILLFVVMRCWSMNENGSGRGYVSHSRGLRY